MWKGGAVAIVDYITETKGNARLPGIITLGYISAFDESLAMSVIAAKGIAPLKVSDLFKKYLYKNISYIIYKGSVD